jgi:cytochrome P450
MMQAATAVRPAPKAPALPGVGSLPLLMALGPLEFYRRMWKQHGDVFRVHLGARSAVVVVHPDGIERVLGSGRERYVKAEAYDSIRMLTGDGLLTLEGEAWRARRRLENPAFHRESVHRFVDEMSSIARESLAAWRWRIPNGGTVDIHHEMMRVTLEIVASTLFGQRLGEDVSDASGSAFADALSLVSERGNALLQLPLTVPTPSNVRFKRALATLDRQVYAVIEKARRAQREGAAQRVPTLLSMLLSARDADTSQGLTDRELRDEVITLFLAGHETTALLMTWGFVLLAKHPDVLDKMREEVDQVVGDRPVTAIDVQQLHYLRRVIDEVLRVRSPVWCTARDAASPDSILGFAVEKGDLVMPMFFLTHQHPAFWQNPEVFDPDRFLPERSKGRHHWSYLPFSMGPRICIGNIFSLTEAALLFATLLQQVEWSMGEGEVLADPTITLRPKGPVPVRIRWRESKRSR